MVISERLLQFIWQFQYYRTENLVTTAGEPLSIIAPGKYNTDQGPDFVDARIVIGQQLWVGNVELHIDSDDWFRHAHDSDPAYRNVILHVVWSDSGRHPSGVAVLELQERVSVLLLDKYRSLMSGQSFIPCGGGLTTVSRLTMISWRERLIVERLERRERKVVELLSCNRFHWEETLWWMVARSFGLTVNAEAFEAMARSIPFATLQRHRPQLLQIEALLLGQAGLLERKPADEYTRQLKKEHRFLVRKYRLTRNPMPVHFLRMRPSSFPTVRLAQLAVLIHRQQHLLQLVLKSSLTSLFEAFDVAATGYWNTHFVLGRESAAVEKRVGRQLIEAILINVAVPLLFAYGRHFGNRAYCEKAEAFLMDLPAESNHVIGAFRKLGMKPDNAGDTQFLLELKSMYCSQWRCLDCAIGNQLLKPTPSPAS